MNENSPYSNKLPPQAPVYTPLPRKSTVFSKSNMLMAGLFMAALVGLYLIHANSGGPTPSAAKGQTVDSDVSKFLQDWRAREKSGVKLELVDTAVYDTKLRQIPPENLLFNPFRYKPIEAPDTAGPKPDGPTEEQIKFIRESEAAKARAKALKLQTIMMGANPTAIVDGSMVTLGETLASDWTLIEINPYEIILEWRGSEMYVLALE